MAKNTLWNLFGQGAPMLAAFLSIPIIIAKMGNARFGTLTLAWVVIGYFSLFDLGLGRAVTQAVAARIKDPARRAEVPTILATALWVMLGLGLVGAIVTALLAPWLSSSVFQIPPELVDETRRSFIWLAISIPALTLTSGLRGVLEALNRFDYANMLRMPMGLFNYLSPFLVFPFSVSLDGVVAILVGGRFLFLILHYFLSRHALKQELGPTGVGGKFARYQLSALLVQGAWMTVSNIVGPIMTYFDRFILGAVIPVALVAYYTTPYEVLTKMWVVPGAVMASVFPLFAAEPLRVLRNFKRGTLFIGLALIVPTVILVIFAHPLLNLWLGPEFADNAHWIVKLLAVGIFINSFAFVPIAYLQASERSHWIAKLYLLELPLYLIGLWWVAKNWGVNGAAIAWLVRSAFDASFLFFLCYRAGLFRTAVSQPNLV